VESRLRIDTDGAHPVCSWLPLVIAGGDGARDSERGEGERERGSSILPPLSLFTTPSLLSTLVLGHLSL
jgi:hypothetical protein